MILDRSYDALDGLKLGANRSGVDGFENRLGIEALPRLLVEFLDFSGQACLQLLLDQLVELYSALLCEVAAMEDQ